MDAQMQPTRRGILGALAASPLAALPIVARAEGSDAALVNAWDFYRQNLETDDDATMRRLCRAEDILADTPAMTLAGIEAKLRLAAEMFVSEHWARDQMLQPMGTPLRETERIDDYCERVLFTALQDVQRLASGMATDRRRNMAR